MSSLSETVKSHLKGYEGTLQLVRNQLNQYRQQMAQIQSFIRQKEQEEAQIYGQIKALTDLIEADSKEKAITVHTPGVIRSIEKVEAEASDDTVEIEEVN